MLATTVAEAGDRYGDRIAVRTSDGDELGYRDLDRASDEAAVGLAALGITRGSLVLLSLPSGLDYIVAYVAAAKLGAATGGINPRLSASERGDLASGAAPDLVLAAPGLTDGLPNHLHIETVDPDSGPPLAELRSSGEAPPTVALDPDEPVCLCFTSGSTGRPKAAWFGGRQLLAAADLDSGGAWGDGHLIAGTAMAHVGFMTKIPWQLAAGATIHVMDRWSAGEVLDLVDTHRMPAVNGVAAQIALMLRHPDFDDHDFSCVQAIVVGAGTSPPTSSGRHANASVPRTRIAIRRPSPEAPDSPRPSTPTTTRPSTRWVGPDRESPPRYATPRDGHSPLVTSANSGSTPRRQCRATGATRNGRPMHSSPAGYGPATWPT